MNKNILVIGDIHGCFYSFKELLHTHWNPEEEQLVQVGDLINKGNHSPLVVQLARKLEREHQAAFIQGNHEYKTILHVDGYESLLWAEQFINPTIRRYDALELDFEGDVQWMKKLPLKWETDHILVTHAGIGHFPFPYSPDNEFGVLWNRSPLKAIGKMQVIGHTPTNGVPIYEERIPYCNVDTGAFKGQFLSGVKLTPKGEVIEFVQVLTDNRDIE